MAEEVVLSSIKHEAWAVEKYLPVDDGPGAAGGEGRERYRIRLLPEEVGDQEVGIADLDHFEVAELLVALQGFAVIDAKVRGAAGTP
jgi:hypothetical protein